MPYSFRKRALVNTRLAIALGLEGCRRGYRVTFFIAAALINEMNEARERLSSLSLERRLSRFRVVIVDEPEYVSFSWTGTQLALEFFSSRYERRSIIITRNLDFANWTAAFQHERLTGALSDRITHHGHIIQAEGVSFWSRQSLTEHGLNLEGEKVARKKQDVLS